MIVAHGAWLIACVDISRNLGYTGSVYWLVLDAPEKTPMFYEKRTCRYPYEQEKEKSYESDLSKIEGLGINLLEGYFKLCHLVYLHSCTSYYILW